MSAVEKIKQAAAELGPDEQFELFRWWTESDAFRQRQLAALKRDITTGLEDLATGRYQTYSEPDVMQLAEDVGSAGRKRLKNPGHESNPRFSGGKIALSGNILKAFNSTSEEMDSIIKNVAYY